MVKRIGLLMCLSALVLGLLVPVGAAEKMTFSIGWIIYGRDLGWLVAEDKGYYKAEGLEVSIQRGFGGADTAKKLGVGSFEVGGVDMATIVLSRAKGIPVRVIGMQHDKAPYLIRTIEGRGINKPKDIEGKKFGTPAGDATWANMPAFAELNGIDLKKVTVIHVEGPSRGPSLVAGAFDASTGFNTEYPMLSRMAAPKGLKIKEFLLADYGLDVYAFGPATTDKVMAERKEVLRKFMTASVKGFADAIKDPDAAVGSLVKREPATDRQIQKEVWLITLTTMLTPDQKRLGLMHMTEEKWKRTRDITAKAFPEAANVPVKDLFTNDLLPKIMPPEPPRM